MTRAKPHLTADKIITDKQTKILLREVGREKDNALNLKYVTDYYLFAIAYYTGLRTSELSDLKWQDIHDDSLTVQNGKGGKSRTVIFGNKTVELFTSYQQFQRETLARSCKPSDPIFIGQRGKLTRIGIHIRMKCWIQRLSLPDKLSFHS